MRVLARWSWVLMLLLAGCVHSTGVEPRRFFMEKALRDEVERRELFEATLRVLDAHPEYIDQLFRLLLEHPESLDHLVAITTSGLDDPQFAALMARHLVRHPEPLTEVMLQALDAIEDKPKAQQALLAALRQRRERVAELLLSDPETLTAMMGALAKRGAEDTALARQLRSLVEGLEPARGGSGQEQGDKESAPKHDRP